MFDPHNSDLKRPTGFIGLGSNVGDRSENVLGAVRAIESSGAARVVALSSLYETAPVGVDSMRDFINAVACVEPLLEPEALLGRLQMLERELGRRSGHNEPREIDLDIISIDLLRMQTDALQLPHPRYADRAFVLVPLAEIAPGFICPNTGREIGAMLSRAAAPEQVRRISGRRMLRSAAHVLRA